ncbi:MAG: cysteine desulfurase family protein [Bacteroidota bacterium]|nr:cysteine desulfurase family protein [Bacteroidota bacterium]
MNFPIYLDNHSTTRLDDRVLEAMLPYLKDNYGNPSSKGHSFGWIAEEAVSNARSLIAKAINASANEIIFTSGTTESNNLAIKGIVGAYSKKKNHLITSAVEHPSVLEVFQLLRNSGFTVSILPVNKYGIIDLNKLRETISEKTLLVSIMMANNEIGTISPIAEIAEICHERSVLFHTDAAQAIGKIDVDVRKINADMISFSAHKNYGPKGIGALYLKKKFPSISLIPQINGGGQERNIRSGTLNVPAIVGFGKAMEITSEALQDENRTIKNLRDKLQMELFTKLDGIYLNGHPEKRLPNNLNISLEGVNIDLLLLELNDLALSTGSACASASPEPSHVLQAIGLNNSLLKSSLRFGLGRFNSKEEIEFTSQRVINAVKKIRAQNK